MNVHTRLRNQRLGLESSTSPLAVGNREIISTVILLLVTNSPIFFLGPGAVSLVAGALTSGITSLAISAVTMGIQYLLMPKPPKPEDGKQPFSQAIPMRIFGVGTNRIGGAYMLWEEKDNYMFMVQALLGHPANDITGFYLHDDAVEVYAQGTVGGSGYEDAFVVTPGDDGRYGDTTPPTVFFFRRLGAVPETPYTDWLVDKLGGEGVWTSNHRGDGQTHMAVVCRGVKSEYFPTSFPYGLPKPSAVIECAKVWDFRDEEQDPDDDTTWTFSKNPVLQMVWWLCFCPFGPQRDYNKVVLPTIDILTEEADICDEDVALAAGGTEKRYECNGWGTTETDPVAVENSIMASCDGWRVWRGDGALIMRVGKFREELVVTITDRDVLGYTIDSDVPEEDEINRLVPTFTYPATDYSTTDTDFFDDTAAQLVAGRILSQKADFGWVQQWRQARRLGKRTFKRFREKIRGSVDLRLTAINAIYSPWVQFDTPTMMPRLDGAIVENRRATLSLMQGGFQMEFNKLPSGIDDWTPAEDEGAAPPVPIRPSVTTVPQPTIDSMAVLVSGSTVTLQVSLVYWNRIDLNPVIRWRLKDDGTSNPGPWSTDINITEWEEDSGLVTVNAGAVPGETIIEVQAALRATAGTLGPRSDTEEISTTIDPVAPGALDGFALTGSAPRLGHATFQIDTGNDEHLKQVAIYRVATGGALDVDDPAQFVKRVYGVPLNSSFGVTDGDDTVSTVWVDPTFDNAGAHTIGANWSVAGGVATHTAGNLTVLAQTISLSATGVYRYGADVVVSAGAMRFRLWGGTNVETADITTSGYKFGKLTNNNTGNTKIDIKSQSTDFAGTVDNFYPFLETVDCVEQGVWDWYAVPENGSGVQGTPSGPVTATII